MFDQTLPQNKRLYIKPDWLILLAIRGDERKKSRETGTSGDCRRI